MTEKNVWKCLSKVIDPELMVDIVGLGLVYSVKLQHNPKKKRYQVEVVMTLTSPGCPLASSFEFMLRDALAELEGLDVERDVKIELTFDPPWTAQMMSDEIKAELGYD